MRRYARARPGELLHLDVKKLGRITGFFGHRITGVRRDTREGAEEVAAKLAHQQILAADLHSAADKRDGKHAMDDFCSARVHVLIASDVAARGPGDARGRTPRPGQPARPATKRA